MCIGVEDKLQDNVCSTIESLRRKFKKYLLFIEILI